MRQGASFQGSSLARGIRQYPKKTRDKMIEIMEEFAEELLDYAQSNAPWEDQTGDAREGLGTAVSGGFEAWGNNAISLSLFHTVDYGIWLEVRWGGKYAIIIPTLETMGPELMSRFEGITEDIIYYV